MMVTLHTTNILAALIMLAFLWYRLDHISDKRQENVIWAFVVAGMYSILLVTFLYAFYPPRLGYMLSYSNLLYHILVVGLVEEVAKFLAFLFIVHTIGHIREPHDGALFGAIVGLTFGMIENMFYFSWYQSWNLLIRVVIGTGGHAVYGAIWGAIYSQAVFVNRSDRDRGTIRNSVIGIATVALLHGMYNASTWFLPLAILVDIFALIIAIVLFRKLVELSPYRVYPLSEAREAVATLKRGLFFNHRSPYLNRNMGFYLMHLGDFRTAAKHLRTSVPRTRDPRRVRFLAAACETTFLPDHHAKRTLRIAWTRLTDDQRDRYMKHLRRLIGPDHAVVKYVENFITEAFKPKRYLKSREVARNAKIKRFERRRSKPAPRLADTIETMDPDEKRHLAEQFKKHRPAGETT
jgi:RsiW-degrading membrane proteinase PrsW (M82 family)